MNAAEAKRITEAAVAVNDLAMKERAERRIVEAVDLVKARVEANARAGLYGVRVRFVEPLSSAVRCAVIKLLENDGFEVKRSSSEDIEVGW
jgi:hypothetical protein